MESNSKRVPLCEHGARLNACESCGQARHEYAALVMMGIALFWLALALLVAMR